MDPAVPVGLQQIIKMETISRNWVIMRMEHIKELRFTAGHRFYVTLRQVVKQLFDIFLQMFRCFLIQLLLG